MARGTPVDPALRKILEEVGEDIVAHMKGAFFECESPYLATVKYKDGNYKKKTLMAGWEFCLTYAFVGVRPQLNFGLLPEDAQEYEYVEMTVQELDKNFPLLGAAVAKSYGLEGEKLDAVICAIMNQMSNKIEAEKKAVESNYDDIPEFGMF